MQYQRLALQCECGRHTTRIREVGITRERELLLYWRCQDCKKHVYAVIPLSEWCQEGLIEEDTATEPGGDPFQETDEIFLHALGVRLPEAAS